MDSLTQIQNAICEFRNVRDWRQFHSPKNLSMSIAIEAAELMEHFQWLTVEQAEQLVLQEGSNRDAITEELADVLIYCFSLADVIGCNVADIIQAKLAKNEAKYPAARYKGRFNR